MRIPFFFSLFALAGAAFAAESIEVTSHFADIPAGTEVPGTPDKLAAIKKVNILSGPKVTLLENVAGTVEVVQPTVVPGGGKVSLGVSLSVKTSITEKGNIWFSGNVTDRSHGGGAKTERLETVGFATREWFFSGYTPSGGTVVIRTSPATARTEREGKIVTATRELVVYLHLKKGSPPPVAKKAGPSGKKPAGLRRTPSKKR